MSEGMQAVAGARLRQLISTATDNRLIACGVGALVTAMIQSSSVTTVMIVGFVSAGFMTLAQAIGVIMGANIGTTLTGWILVLDLGLYALPLLGLASFFFLFARNERLRYLGMSIMGIGMIIYGLQIMSSGFKPIRDLPEFLAWFSKFQADTYVGALKCVFLGAAVTAIIQASAAALGITMGLASSGVIDFNTAAALVIGQNIGTTVTALMASFGTTNLSARRAAYSHILFNVLGALWVVCLFYPYMKLIKLILGIDPGIAVEGVDGLTYPHINMG